MKLSRLSILIIQLFLAGTTYAQPGDVPSAISMPGPQIGVAYGFTYGVDAKPQVFLPQLRNMGVNLTKLYLFWQQVEPVKGQFVWNAIDSFINQLTPNDEALIALFSSSRWATKVSSQTLPPSPAKSPDDYYRFIYNLVKHCKGKIKFWQNDCEPNNPVYWNGTDEEFITELKTFYRAVKDADPGAQVVAGGYDGLFNPPGMPEIPGQKYGLAFFNKVIKEAADYFDIFDLRLYANPYTIPARVQYFKQLLAETGNNKPLICTEYDGPGFFGFPVNFKYIGQVVAWQKAVSTRDTATYLNLKNPLAQMYDSINSLAPQTQMFMMGSSKDLDDKYHRLQCRDIVMRNILAFSAGVQKTMYWDLWHNSENKYDVMTLMFGKNKLVEYENNKLAKQYPEAETFKRMTGYLDHLETIKRINILQKDSLYLFEISRTGKSAIYVAWEKRDAFSGEDLPAVTYNLPWNMAFAKATDVFGKSIPASISNGNLTIAVSETPVYIETVDKN